MTWAQAGLSVVIGSRSAERAQAVANEIVGNVRGDDNVGWCIRRARCSRSVDGRGGHVRIGRPSNDDDDCGWWRRRTVRFVDAGACILDQGLIRCDAR